MTSPIMQLEDVTFSYGRNSAPALSGLDLAFNEGSRTVVLGANGAGKSTLFSIMNAIHKPTSGRVLYNGEPMGYRRRDVLRMRSEVSILFQNPDDMLFKPYVWQDVAFGPENAGLPKDEVRRRVDDALFSVGMLEFKDRATMRLSYGQRKRVALAGVIAMHPKILILDEPTAGLDPQMSFEVMEMADELHALGTTVVMSSHDTDLTYSWADDVHVLRGGRCVFSGDPNVFYADSDNVLLSGLLPPRVFTMNEGISDMSGVSTASRPRTPSQLTACVSESEDYGTLHLVLAGDDIDVDSFVDSNGFRDCPVGIYGTSVRRAVENKPAKVDFFYNAPESCVMECLTGRDAVLVCDPIMEGCARRSADFVNSLGRGKIKVEVKKF